MKVIFWTYIFIIYSFLQGIIDPPDIFETEFALRIIRKRHLDHKSFCIFSNESHTTDDLRSLNQVIADIMDQDFGFTFHFDEEDSRIFVASYFKFIHNQETYMKILEELIMPDDCQFTISNKDDLPELIINKLTSNLDNLTLDSSPELLALACQSEILLNELSVYSGSVNRKEKVLSDVSVFNYATKMAVMHSSDKTQISLLVKRTREFMEKKFKPNQLPSIPVILCLVVKSIKSYENHSLEIIKKSYEIIVNVLKEDEMCELSTLHEDNIKIIDDSLKSVNGTKLSKTERDGIKFGFEDFVMSILNTNEEIDLYMYISNYGYLSRDCGFNKELFSSEYGVFIKSVKKYWNKGMQISNIGEMITIFCIYSNMRNYREIKESLLMTTYLPRIIGSYNTFINLLRNKLIHFELYLSLMTRIIEEDSRYLELYIKNSYLNKFTFECKLLRFRDNTTNYYEYSKLIHPFLYDYAYIYCSTKKSDPKLFADRLSVGLIGVRDDKVLSFESIALLVDQFLDKSSDDIFVTIPDVFEFSTDRCHIRAINYNRIHYEKVLFEKPDHESVSKTIIPMCSLFKSVSKVGTEYNNPVSTTIWMIIIDSSIDLMKSVSFMNLKFDDKFKDLKDYINDKLKSHSPTQGTSMRIECEIRTILNNGLPDLSSGFLQDLYIHLTAKYPNRICQLDTSMFHKRTSKLIFHLKKYPGFSDMDESKIGAYLLFVKRSIPDIVSNLTSYAYPDVIAPLLVDNDSCSYHRTSLELNQIISAYNVNIYKENKPMWMNYVVFHTCLLSRDTKTFISELYENKNLSPAEIEELTQLYKETLTENPDLSENNEQNIKTIIDIISNKEEFKNYNSNPIKLLIAKCYLRKLHYNIVDESSSTSTTISSSSSTYDSPTPKSSSISTVKSHAISTSPSSTVPIQKSLNQITTEKSKENLSDDNLTNKSPSKQKLSTGAIIGISIACIIIIILIIFGIIYSYRKNLLNFTKNRTITYKAK